MKNLFKIIVIVIALSPFSIQSAKSTNYISSETVTVDEERKLRLLVLKKFREEVINNRSKALSNTLQFIDQLPLDELTDEEQNELKEKLRKILYAFIGLISKQLKS